MPVSGIGSNPSTVTVEFDIPASAPAGQTIAGNITAFGPLVPASATVVIPPTQRWYFYAISTTDGPVGPDGRVQILLNGDLQYFQPSLSQTSLSVLRGYTFPAPVKAKPNTTISFILTLIAANTLTTEVIQNVQFDIVKYQISI
jgi:hypothetical protein